MKLAEQCLDLGLFSAFNSVKLVDRTRWLKGRAKLLVSHYSRSGDEQGELEYPQTSCLQIPITQ